MKLLKAVLYMLLSIAVYASTGMNAEVFFAYHA